MVTLLTLCRAHISHYDGSFGMAVRRCFSFSDVNTTVELVGKQVRVHEDMAIFITMVITHLVMSLLN